MHQPEAFADGLRARGLSRVEMLWLNARLGREGARFNGRCATPQRTVLVSAKVA